MDEITQLRAQVARLNAMLYSVIKRHPQAADWNLELKDVASDTLPEKIFTGWNTVGDDAILTVLFGESLQNMINAATAVNEEDDED